MKRLTESVGGTTAEHADPTNPILAVISRRRSVRELYIDRVIPDEVVRNIVISGLSAPSSKNAKPWQLHVVTKRGTLINIADSMITPSEEDIEKFVPKDPLSGKPREAYSSTVAESAEVLRQVPLAIFLENRGKFSESRQVVASSPKTVIDEAILGMGLEYIGLGACIENMWLAAEAQGLSGNFMGDVIIAETYIKDRLSMVGDLVGALALGYSDTESEARPVNSDNVTYH